MLKIRKAINSRKPLNLITLAELSEALWESWEWKFVSTKFEKAKSAKVREAVNLRKFKSNKFSTAIT